MTIKKIMSINRSNDQLSIDWSIGKKCNFDCSFCVDNVHDNFSKPLKFEVFKKALLKIKKAYPEKKLEISLDGGEPFLNPDILKIVKFCKDQEVRVGTTSNGSAKLDLLRDVYKYLDYLIISLHQEFYSESIKNKIIELNKMSKTLNKFFRVNLMILPGYIDKIKEDLKFLNGNNIPYIMRKVRPLTYKKSTFILPYKLRNKRDNKQYFNKTELDFLSKYSENNIHADIQLIYDDNTIKNINSNELVFFGKTNFKGWKCRTMFEQMLIKANGDVHYCISAQPFGNKIGNIYTEDFKIIKKDIFCKSDSCNCISDLHITKERI